jgi:hypothetical protein
MRLILCAVLLALNLHSFALAQPDNSGSANPDGSKTDPDVAIESSKAEPDVIEPGVIEKVLESVRENYRPLRAVKARVRSEIISNFKFDTPPANAAPPPAAPNPELNAQSTLKVYHAPSMLIEWTAQLAGENQRYDILSPMGREIVSADAAGVTEHDVGTKKANLMPWTMPYITGGMLQYDPREAGFVTMGVRLAHILTSGEVTAARFIERSDEETIAEIRAPTAFGDNSVVIECSSRFNFLPTRVYYVFEDRATIVTNVMYEQVQSDPSPIWFLKSAVQRYAFPHKNTSPDDKDWGKVKTITVLELETDVVPPPPRDDAQSLPAGTTVTDHMPRPPPAPVPIAPLFSRNTVLLGVALVVVILGTAVALAVSKIRAEN